MRLEAVCVLVHDVSEPADGRQVTGDGDSPSRRGAPRTKRVHGGRAGRNCSARMRGGNGWAVVGGRGAAMRAAGLPAKTPDGDDDDDDELDDDDDNRILYYLIAQ